MVPSIPYNYIDRPTNLSLFVFISVYLIELKSIEFPGVEGNCMIENTIELTMKNQEEDAIIAAAQRDPAAFEQLYNRYVQALFRYLYSRVSSVSVAEDLTAQTFLSALEGFNRYKHRGHFAAWLFSIGRSKLMDYYRQQRRLIPLEAAEEVPVEPDLLQKMIQSERVAALARQIAALPETARELIRLRYVAELSFCEIAKLDGRNQEAIKKSLYRLLARLQSQLKESHD
jgi:RNA polymerase sigma-70 factor, ECF subfamily